MKATRSRRRVLGKRKTRRGGFASVKDACTAIANAPTLKDAEREYKKASRIFHPDKGGDTAEFQMLGQCYDDKKEGRTATAPAPQPRPAPAPAPQPRPVPAPQPRPAPAPQPRPVPAPQPRPVPAPQPRPAPAPQPRPAPAPQPTPAPAPQQMPEPGLGYTTRQQQEELARARAFADKRRQKAAEIQENVKFLISELKLGKRSTEITLPNPWYKKETLDEFNKDPPKGWRDWAKKGGAIRLGRTSRRKHKSKSKKTQRKSNFSY